MQRHLGTAVSDTRLAGAASYLSMVTRMIRKPLVPMKVLQIRTSMWVK